MNDQNKSEIEWAVVSPVTGLSKVGAYRGSRVDGYVTVFLPVGTLVTNVRKFPFELKKYWADLDGETMVFWKDTLKRAPRKKQAKD